MESDISRLRQREEEAFADVISVQRRLARRSPGVTFNALRQCKARLDAIQEELLFKGELPGLFLRRYFYLIDRATVERSPAGVCVAFPVIPAVADFRDGPLDDRFLFDIERSLDAVCASSGAARLMTMQVTEPAEGHS
ncbi:hypothetical protein QZM43_32665 [Burkholderia orbicola]|uniref:hypothetical protein n=1 Tax=Burkholderia cepacia complex TaxID=87882 RepID=UPI00190560A4|nr:MULTISPECIES: hypothetical protein [Burkholderia cepacia complex]MBJ9594108.1 hypothetical protein [Burkholderia seminalis]MDN7472536.1 hypothetical protein [Burkholderia orbicola]MDN7507498.1 hypothetical protein [Burkholderia orbicola]